MLDLVVEGRHQIGIIDRALFRQCEFGSQAATFCATMTDDFVVSLKGQKKSLTDVLSHRLTRVTERSDYRAEVQHGYINRRAQLNTLENGLPTDTW